MSIQPRLKISMVMRSRSAFRVQFFRNIYVPAVKSRQSITGTGRSVKSRLEQQEAELLDRQLNEIKAKQEELRRKIEADNESKAKDKILRTDISKEASDVDVQLLENQLSMLPAASPNITGKLQNLSIVDKLPPSVQNAIGAYEFHQRKGLALFKEQPTWGSVLSKIPTLNDISTNDIAQLMSSVQVKERATLINEFERIVPSDKRTQQIRDLFMAAYAETGQLSLVLKFFKECEHPTVYSFGNVCKAYFKTGAEPEIIANTIKDMELAGLKAPLPVISVLLQSFIQHSRHDEAAKLFDSLKYMSVSTQPDLKLYNAMILSYAKQYNINKCLDLFTEMRNRRPYPLEPNGETYNYMIYACSRDPNTHILAWNFFIELQRSGKYTTDKNSFRALMYLCGCTGEVLLSRALLRKLSERSTGLIDNYSVNCLMNAYSHWKPFSLSAILSSPAGHQIRESVFAYSGVIDTETQLPLLPTAQLTSEVVLAESNSIFEYFAELNIDTLINRNKASKAEHPALHNFLKVAINLSSTIDEFKRRFNRFTTFPQEKSSSIEKLMPETVPENVIENQPSPMGDSKFTPTAPHPEFVVNRDQGLYSLALQAATKFRDVNFAKQVWMERGLWRKTHFFRDLPQNKRNSFDFQFARDLVNLLAECGNIEEAVMLVTSAQNLKKWKRIHLSTLIRKCEEIEDAESIAKIKRLLWNSQKNCT